MKAREELCKHFKGRRAEARFKVIATKDPEPVGEAVGNVS